MSKKLIILGVVLSICVNLLYAESQTCTIYADHDCLVSKSNPNTNYNQTQLEVGTTDDHVRMSFLHFNLESIPSNAFIQDAELFLYCTQNVFLELIEVTEVSSSWDETTITWNNMPDVRTSEYYYFTPDNSYPYWNHFDVTYSVLLWYAGNNINYGFRLGQYFSYNNRWANFFSKESSQNLYTPMLIVTYEINSGPSSVPDINIDDIWFEGTDNIVQGEPFDFHVDFTNNGNAIANNIEIYYEAYYDGRWNEIGNDTHASLDANTTQEENEDCIGDYIPGSVPFRVRIPAVANETNTSNNIKSITWDVISPTRDEWIYYDGDWNTIFRMRPEDSNHQIVKPNCEIKAVSSDNKYALFISYTSTGTREFFRHNLDGTQNIFIPIDIPSWATFDNDNSNVTYFLSQSNIYKYDFTTRILNQLTDNINIISKINPALSPNGKYLAFAANQSDIMILNLETNQTNIISDNNFYYHCLPPAICWRGNNNIYYTGEDQKGFPIIWHINIPEGYKHEIETSFDAIASFCILKCNQNKIIFSAINADSLLERFTGSYIVCYDVLTNEYEIIYSFDDPDDSLAIFLISSPSDYSILFEIENNSYDIYGYNMADNVYHKYHKYHDYLFAREAIWAGKQIQLEELIDPYYGDVNQNDEIGTDDALFILRNVLNMSDSHLDRLAFYNADLTVNDTISALDASFILQYMDDKIEYLPIFDSKNYYNSAGDIVMEDVQFNSYDTVNIPLYLENAENVFALSGEISFDDSIISFVDIVLSEPESGLLKEAFAYNGKVKFALASKDTINDSPLFSLVFSIDQSQDEEEVNISINKIQLNESNFEYNPDEITFRINTSMEEVPTKYYLLNNYPNPFNPFTKIEYSLPSTENVILNIYDISGRKIKEWSIGNQQAGWHEVVWNGTDQSGSLVSTGVYIYCLQAGDFVDTKKMVFMK